MDRIYRPYAVRHLGVLALAWLGAALGAATAQADDCRPAVASTVALDLDASGLARVPVEIDGTHRLLLVDTGSPVSVLRENVVEALGLERFPIPLDMVAGIGGRPFQERAVAHTVTFGQIHAPNVSYLVEPLTHAGVADAADGIIGADQFSGFDVELDFPARRMILYRRGTCPPEFTGPKTIVVLHVRLAPGAHIMLPVTLDGQAVEALLDTGASTSVLTLEAAHRLFGLAPGSAGMVRAGEIQGADGGRVTAYARRFSRLAVGAITLPSPVLALMEDETRRVHRVAPAGVSGAPEFMPDLILGMDQMRRLRLYIAYGAKTVYVGQGASPPP
jgi:predicted aspartyl protease